MKRYDLITNYRCGSAIEEMEPSDDGEWVRYEDVEAELKARERIIEIYENQLANAEPPRAAAD